MAGSEAELSQTIQIGVCPACDAAILASVTGTAALSADSPGPGSALRILASFRPTGVDIRHTCPPPF